MIPNDDPKLKEQLSKIWQQSEERLAKAAAGKQRTAYLDLREAPIQIEAYKLLSEEKAKAAEILVIERKGYSLAAAAVNPQRAETVAVIKELKDQGFKISLFEVSKESLEYGLTLYDQLPKDRSEITTRVDVSAEKVAELEKELTSLQECVLDLEAVIEDKLQKRRLQQS